jgi:AcrR family transcriptional regulator
MRVTAGRLPVGSGARQERAERILDTTAGLLELHGYRRVTIDDVARQTGIGKGTIYLHWKTREALFWAVLARETLRLLTSVVDLVAKDDRLAMPHRLMPLIFVEATKRPLVRALLLPDAEVLGNLSQDETVLAAQNELSGNPEYVKILQEEKLLAPELSVEGASCLLNNLMGGFFHDGEQGTAGGLSLEERADLIAYVLRRSLQVDESAVTPEATAALGVRVIELFNSIISTYQTQLLQAY